MCATYSPHAYYGWREEGGGKRAEGRGRREEGGGKRAEGRRCNLFPPDLGVLYLQTIIKT